MKYLLTVSLDKKKIDAFQKKYIHLYVFGPYFNFDKLLPSSVSNIYLFFNNYSKSTLKQRVQILLYFVCEHILAK